MTKDISVQWLFVSVCAFPHYVNTSRALMCFNWMINIRERAIISYVDANLVPVPSCFSFFALSLFL